MSRGSCPSYPCSCCPTTWPSSEAATSTVLATSPSQVSGPYIIKDSHDTVLINVTFINFSTSWKSYKYNVIAFRSSYFKILIYFTVTTEWCGSSSAPEWINVINRYSQDLKHYFLISPPSYSILSSLLCTGWNNFNVECFLFWICIRCYLNREMGLPYSLLVFFSVIEFETIMHIFLFKMYYCLLYT
jgi:hypothetical protein